MILSAKRVGPTGTAYGLDMTDEMLALAQENARDAGVANVHFLKGIIEHVPLRELGRRRDLELRHQPLDRQARGADGDRARPQAGRTGRRQRHRRRGPPLAGRAGRARELRRLHRRRALEGEAEAGLEAAGFEQVSVEFTHEVADGMHGAIVKAVKTSEPEKKGLVIQPAAKAGCC